MPDRNTPAGARLATLTASRAFRFFAAGLVVAAITPLIGFSRSIYHARSVPDCDGAQAIDNTCFIERYIALTRLQGSDVALADLATRQQSNQSLHASCHQLTHAIGRTAGEIQGKAAFSSGTDLCAAGYYHGIVETVMMKIGAAQFRDRAASVCAEQREGAPKSHLHYNCVHGMGHGFMAVFQSDVFQSLSGCDVLTDPWEQRHCYGGVFMENLSAIGHSSRPSTHLRPHEPLYPCTAVDARYKGDCYIEQTAYALSMRNNDFAAVFALCRNDADAGFRNVCYEGLGGDAAIMASKFVIGAAARADTLRQLCLLGPDDDARAHCIMGAISTIVRDTSGDDTQARVVCGALHDQQLTSVCNNALREEAQAFPTGPVRHQH